MDANMEPGMTDTTSRASQPVTLLSSAVIAAVVGVSGGAGITHFSTPALESRIDKLESTKVLMEYQIQELKGLLKQRCQADDRYSALAQEGVKVKMME